jgi:hypothetical protein
MSFGYGDRRKSRSRTTIVGRDLSSNKVVTEIKVPAGDRISVLSRRTFEKATKRASEILRNNSRKDK